MLKRFKHTHTQKKNNNRKRAPKPSDVIVALINCKKKKNMSKQSKNIRIMI